MARALRGKYLEVSVCFYLHSTNLKCVYIIIIADPVIESWLEP